VRRLILLLAALAATLCGCGVGVQSTPEAITVALPSGLPSAAPSSGPVPETAFFVRGTRLLAVPRRGGAHGGLRQVLALLTVGPSPEEARNGTRTAVAPQTISVQGLDGRGNLTLGVTRQFTAVVGSDQLLAVAQVVWTVTQFPWVDGVRFVSDGQSLEVPTDHGLVHRAVTRADYRSVAPPRGSPTTTPAAPT
jgi:hypothetical protein